MKPPTCDVKGCQQEATETVSAYNAHWKRSWNGRYCAPHANEYRKQQTTYPVGFSS